MTILGFNKKELFSLVVILSFVGAITYTNLQISLRRGRDVQRKNDLQVIADALIAFQTDRASFPPAFEGKIVSCFGGNDELGVPQAVPCDWYRDGLYDIVFGETYLLNLPTDPHHNQGARYYYLSNGRYFQLYAALEGEDEAEYDEKIVKRGIMCGNRVCNFGLGFMETPLDKSIEEYENEIRSRDKL